MSLIDGNDKYLYNLSKKGYLETIRLVSGSGIELDAKKMKETISDVMKDDDKRDKIEKIWSLGSSLVGPVSADGFLVCWITKQIIDNYKKTHKTEVNIEVDEREVSEDEMKEYVIEALEGFIHDLKKNPDSKIESLPVSPTNNLRKK